MGVLELTPGLLQSQGVQGVYPSHLLTTGPAILTLGRGYLGLALAPGFPATFFLSLSFPVWGVNPD